MYFLCVRISAQTIKLIIVLLISNFICQCRTVNNCELRPNYYILIVNVLRYSKIYVVQNTDLLYLV